MSQKLSDAMSKVSLEGASRNSMPMGRPLPSPGVKRNSGLDPSIINSMFPDAAAAIAKQKEQFTQQTGMAPPSTRNSVAGDRASLVAPTISAPAEDTKKESLPQPPASPWGPRTTEGVQQPIARPKSSSGQQPQPMGQFAAPQASAGLRSPRPGQLTGDANLQSTTLTAPDNTNLTNLLSPYQGSGNWASMVNTPMVPNFQTGQPQREAEMVANATAMKLAALSTSQKALSVRERALEGAALDYRFNSLNDLAAYALEAGDTTKAEQYANEVLKLAPEFRESWNYGNAVHNGNIILGRIALLRGGRS
jgi:hypothetical protein